MKELKSLQCGKIHLNEDEEQDNREDYPDDSIEEFKEETFFTKKVNELKAVEQGMWR